MDEWETVAPPPKDEWEPVSAPQQKPTGAGAYDDKIKHFAQARGVDPAILHNLIKQESGFNPAARSSAGAIGIAQFMPDTAKEYGIDPTNPEQSIDGAARYLQKALKRYHGDYMRAVASYNAGMGNVDAKGVDALKVPGADPHYLDRILGPLGMSGWNKPIAGAADASQEWAPVGTPPPAAKKTTDHSILDKVFGAVDAPYILGNASFRGDTPEARRASIVSALTQLVHDPASANDEYGLGAKPQLEYERDHDVHTTPVAAQWWLDHPVQTGVVAGAGELFNPLGEVANTGVGRAFKYIGGTPAGMTLLNFFHDSFSPMKGVLAAGGQEGKRAMQALLVRVAAAPAEAQHAALSIFGNLDAVAQEDVVHAFQGQTGAVKSKDPTVLAEIGKRAALLRDYTDKITNKQVTAGTLDPRTAAANPDHFGMAGAYKDPHLTPQQQETFERSHGGAGNPITSKGTEKTQALYKTLHEAQTSALAPMKDDFHVVTQAERNFAHGLKNAAFEDAAKNIPDTLLKKNVPRSPLNPPKDGAGKDMVHFDDIKDKDPELAQFISFSPALNKSYMSDSLYQWLKKNSTKIYDDRPLYETLEPGSWQRGVVQAWGGLNNATRSAIVTNPFFHPAWNLARNAAGAGLPPLQVASLVTKTIANTLGGGRAIEWMEKKVGYNFQAGVADAIKAGAVAELKTGSSDTTRRLAAKYADLGTGEKILKAFDTAAAWNARMTFGPRGEEAFSNALYKHLMKSGQYTKLEAGGLVREALGNYQNVDKNAWQNQVIFFYPWLKGNMNFWLRKGLSNAARADQRGARVNNQLVGDPEENTPGGRTQDYQFTYHDKAKGEYGRGSMPVPQRMLPEALDLMGADGPAQAGKTAANMISGRAQPAIGTAIDTGITTYQSARDPGDAANYHTILDKRQDAWTQARQAAGYLAGRGPIPLIGFQARDALRTGQVPDGKDLAIGAITGLSTHPDDNSSDYKKKQRIDAQFNRLLKVANKKPAGPARDKALANARKVYDTRRAKYEEQLSRKHKPVAAPKQDEWEPAASKQEEWEPAH